MIIYIILFLNQFKFNFLKIAIYELNLIFKDFSNLTSYRLLLERTYLTGHEIINKSNEPDAQILSQKLNNLNKKWKALISLLNEFKEK